MTDFAPLPPPPDVPTAAQIADAIAAGIPTAQRQRAIDLLGQQIVPWQLRDLATFDRPRRLTEVVYEDLVDELRPIAADKRGDRLEVIGCRTTGERLLGDAMGLAIARWQADHPGKAAPAPWDEVAKPWAGRPIAQLGAEADARLAQVEQLTKEKSGDCREAMRMSLVHARMALGSTRTGSFATAAGALVDFLRAVGETPQKLDVH